MRACLHCVGRAHQRHSLVGTAGGTTDGRPNLDGLHQTPPRAEQRGMGAVQECGDGGGKRPLVLARGLRFRAGRGTRCGIRGAPFEQVADGLRELLHVGRRDMMPITKHDHVVDHHRTGRART
jgi:hypothetical protein